MHILGMAYENGPAATRRFRFAGTDIPKPKWCHLPVAEAGLILRRIAWVCTGAELAVPLGPYPCPAGSRERIEIMIERHAPRDRSRSAAPLAVLLMRWDPQNGARSGLSAHGSRLLPGRLGTQRFPGFRSGGRVLLLRAYGPSFQWHRGTDDFDFSDRFFRANRVASLFSSDSKLSDPHAVWQQLQYRSGRGRKPAQEAIEVLCDAFSELTRHAPPLRQAWKKAWDGFDSFWLALEPAERAEVTVLLDAFRHAIDASPHELRAWERPAVILLQEPERFCGSSLESWLTVMDRVFVNTQFIVGSRSPVVRDGPLSDRRLESVARATGSPADRPRVTPNPSPTDALLIDVDGRLPNLALMKLATWLRQRRRSFRLARGCPSAGLTADEVYASCVFQMPGSEKRMGLLRARFGERLRCGGTGVDYQLRLPPEVEALPSDYSLYPQLGDRAIGFLTRGCPGSCAFCVVPKKEGGPRQVADLDTLLEGGRRSRLILLDDNLLAHPEADSFLEDIVRRDVAVNFNQSLDILRITPERAGLLRRIRAMNVKFTRSVYHFSLNDCRNLEKVSQSYDHLGFRPGDNVGFICMYGLDTTLADDVKRFRFLHSLPGAYVTVQRYRPIRQGPPPQQQGFFSADADELVDELIAICFSQNMKSMETYYRWLSERYYREFGKLHMGLVDTIFRYNHRDRRGHYLYEHPRCVS